MENAALTDSLCTRDDSERHQRLLQENEELKRQIAQVRNYGHITKARKGFGNGVIMLGA